jgi:hypothetical protein
MSTTIEVGVLLFYAVCQYSIRTYSASEDTLGARQAVRADEMGNTLLAVAPPRQISQTPDQTRVPIISELVRDPTGCILNELPFAMPGHKLADSIFKPARQVPGE